VSENRHKTDFWEIDPEKTRLWVGQVYAPDIFQPLELPQFLEAVPAGFPSPAEDFLQEKLDLNRHLIQHPHATFFSRVQGDSMTEAGIHSGDLLIVDRALEATGGQVVIAAVDGELTVKRLVKRGKHVYLQAANPNYPPLKIRSETHCVVWGVVTYAIHRVR
jgi:DNA polymerase V